MNLPNDLFNTSSDLSKKSLQDNPYSQRKDPTTCPHERSENWDSNYCADCGTAHIGGTRVADEKRFAETANDLYTQSIKLSRKKKNTTHFRT